MANAFSHVSTKRGYLRTCPSFPGSRGWRRKEATKREGGTLWDALFTCAIFLREDRTEKSWTELGIQNAPGKSEDNQSPKFRIRYLYTGRPTLVGLYKDSRA